MKARVLILIIVALPIVSAELLAQQTLNAVRISQAPVIDGHGADEVWKEVPSICCFADNYPSFGGESGFPTNVKMAYDDNALYIFARLDDPIPDSVSYTLSQRDDYGNADWFGIQLDPFGKKQNGFAFYVTAAGVELDALMSIDDEDFSWNAVWRSAVTRSSSGWQVEIRIPLSAFRFPNEEVQNWRINFKRQVRRCRQMSFWNPVDPSQLGEITQMGQLTGIEGIRSPIRLAFVPYVTGYVENVSAGNGEQNWSQRATGGMDVKYGVNDAFTIDMTLIPDFGQTVSDNQVLNLSPYEIRFNENRPFFLEGTDLFGIGGLFYSRRIGGAPYNQLKAYQEVDAAAGETVTSNPVVSPLVNATKFSGRTKNGLGIGAFNAIENRSFAIIEDSSGQTRRVETNPLTNYNVMVFSQNFENSSSLSLVNTNTFREGRSRDANVTLVKAKWFTPQRTHSVIGTMSVSAVNKDGKLTTGHSWYTEIGKVRGEWRYQLSYLEESDTYDPNDLGYLEANNERTLLLTLRKYRFAPKGRFLRRWNTFSLEYNRLYYPDVYSDFQILASSSGTFRNFLSVGLETGINPIGRMDYFESRQRGRPVYFAPQAYVGGFYSSDYSKPFALDIWVNYFQRTELEQRGGALEISPRVRVSDRLFFVWSSSIEELSHDYGYVAPQQTGFENEVVLGDRHRRIVTNFLQSELIFTKRMGVYLRFRHYWQRVTYTSFSALQSDGSRRMISYNPLNEEGKSVHNTSYNAFTIDMNFRWVFFPGSEWRVNWKYNIFNSVNVLDPNYFSTFSTLFDQPQFNSISVKFLMYVDVLYFRSRQKKQLNGSL